MVKNYSIVCALLVPNGLKCSPRGVENTRHTLLGLKLTVVCLWCRLVRSTSSLQGTIPRSRSSQSSLDLMSIRDSSDEMEPLGGESRNIRRSQSFDRKVNADHMCFCKELQPTAAFQEFIKRLLIFIPN